MYSQISAEKLFLPLTCEVLSNDNHVREMTTWHLVGLIWV